MPDDNIIEVKEKVNWKENEFTAQGGLCRNCITLKGTDSIALQFKKWYHIIPKHLKDQEIISIWEDFDLTISPTDSDKWLTLLNTFWDWAYIHGMVMTLQAYNPLEIEWNELGRMTKEKDIDGIRQWATTRID